MKSIAVLQSNYIPWKGYFDIINSVDEFVLYDDVQYTRSDWRNRNLIKAKEGLKWLTVPVIVKGKHEQKIDEAKVANNIWAIKHWETIRHNYVHSRYFEDYAELFERTYKDLESIQYLTEINLKMIKIINSILGIGTKITKSSNYRISGDKNEKIIHICEQTGANEYLTGPAAKNYLDESLFNSAGINVIWMDYTCYPEYHQLTKPFDHKVSVIDLIFNEGKNAPGFMKSFK